MSLCSPFFFFSKILSSFGVLKHVHSTTPTWRIERLIYCNDGWKKFLCFDEGVECFQQSLPAWFCNKQTRLYWTYFRVQSWPRRRGLRLCLHAGVGYTSISGVPKNDFDKRFWKTLRGGVRTVPVLPAALNSQLQSLLYKI